MSETSRLEDHYYSEIVPLQEQGIDELGQTIAELGQQLPIYLWDGKILDGRRRYRACLKHKLAPWVKTYKPEEHNGLSPLDYVCLMNFHRRHEGDSPERGKAIDTYLREHPEKSNGEIASRCLVTSSYVYKRRALLEGQGDLPPTAQRTDKRGFVHETPPKDEDPSQAKKPRGTGTGKGSVTQRTPNSPEPQPPAPPPADAKGDPLPEHLQDVFADTFYDSVIVQANTWIRHVHNNPSYYKRLQSADGFLGALEDVKRAAGWHRPHAVCPHCKGTGNECGFCMTDGWLSHGESFQEDVYAHDFQRAEPTNTEGD